MHPSVTSKIHPLGYPMQLIAVSSSNIARLGYDPKREILRVEFRKSGIYDYSGVPAAEYDRLLRATSIGAYFQQYIRDKYSTLKVG